MPRRKRADPLSVAIGRRIRQLREEKGLTLEKLAYESELSGKGHLSSVEHGLVRPTAQTLKTIADGLGVLLLDLVTFPEEDDRQRLVDKTRRFPPDLLQDTLAKTESVQAPGRRKSNRAPDE